MKKFTLNSVHKRLLADTVTPVSIYLKLRDRYMNPIMLESSDYHGNENSFSYICFEPIASFILSNNQLKQQFPDGTITEETLEEKRDAVDALSKFSSAFEVSENEFDFINNGLFGYMAFDAVKYFEDVEVEIKENGEERIPEICYNVYRYVIAIDHFKNELHIFEHHLEGEQNGSGIDQVASLIDNKNHPGYSFNIENEEHSNLTDEEFLDIIAKGKSHCHRGDVFQIVLSRRFQSAFKGDEFNVYRALRSINPSPYLFYFDYGSYKIFGSSPEAQIVVKKGEAIIYPIAGTFKRTGHDQADAELAQKLYDDPKENSEHVMLVDLARNDLSRNCEDVEVETFKEIQYYSHVIHLVSKVTGKLKEGTSPIKIVADTFPAGTLSGAPKHMALQLINKYENTNRGYYGGAIGFLGFDGDFNHAIMIRSFLSKDNQLFYQAGAGIVDKSDINSELQEVHNKLGALRQAIKMAEEIS
ncbi:anthranilate synthase component I family protein [Fulvivirgaceae bacterium BMA10]|uniref:Anthranilate synthase component 1 n=1 Tax=Splendidivirga corallicola TaxID=3051826 RepID=A0ABT8KHV5_9BACT|nr:anthranilate synthase component I family protein [Fulvivirgaceae bacterium BMA10]